MSACGVFAVDRGIWSDPDFADEPFTEREAFMWLVGAAAWKPARTRGNTGQPVELQRGEFSFSVRFLAEKWKWETTRVHRFLKTLEKRNTVCNSERNGSSVYSIRNYNRFQVVGLPDATEDATVSATTVQQKRNKEETLKHRNNTRPNGRDARAGATRLPDDFVPSDDDALAVGLEAHRIPEEVAKFRDYFAAAPGQKGLKQDWPATWRNWARKAAAETARPPRGPPRSRGYDGVIERAEAFLRSQEHPPDEPPHDLDLAANWH